MIQEFDIILDQPNKVHFSGDNVTGHVLLKLDSPLPIRCVMIKFIGEAKYKIPTELLLVNRHEKQKKTKRKPQRNNKVGPAPIPTDTSQNTSKQDNDIKKEKNQREFRVNKETYFDKGIFLFGHKYSSFREHLSEGTHKLPFQYTLPVSLPATFSGRFSFIHYYCEALLERWAAPIEKRRVYFSVSNIADINHEPKADLDCDMTKTTSCWLLCCPRGSIVVTTRLNRLGVVPGQMVPLETDIQNMSNMYIAETFISIIQVTSHHSRHGVLIYEDERLVTICSKGPVPQGDFVIWTDCVLVPPLPPSSFGVISSKIISISYKLQVYVELSRGNDPIIIKMPLIVGNIPFKKDFKLFETKSNSDLENQIHMPNIFKMMPDFPIVWSESCCKNLLKINQNYVPRYPFYKLRSAQNHASTNCNNHVPH